jgi:hypothetical protein
MLTRRNERRRPTIGRRPRRGAWARTRISGSLFPAAWSGVPDSNWCIADWQSAVLATGRIPRTYGAEHGCPSASNWFGGPAPKRSANPAKTHLSCCQTTYYTVSRDRRIRTSFAPASEAGKISQAPLRPVVHYVPRFKMVGMLGLEPRSPCSQSRWVSRYPTSRKYFNPKAKGPESFGDRGLLESELFQSAQVPGRAS